MQDSIIVNLYIKIVTKINNYYKNSVLSKLLKTLSKWISNQIRASKVINFFSRDWKEDKCWTNSFFYKLFIRPIIGIKKIRVKSHILSSKYGIVNIIQKLLSIPIKIYAFFLFTALSLELFLAVLYKDWNIKNIIIKLSILFILFILTKNNNTMVNLLQTSRIYRFITNMLKKLGDNYTIISKEEKTPVNNNLYYHYIIAIGLGLIMGIIGFAYPIKTLLAIIIIFIGILAILWKVELGVSLIVLLVSFLPTMAVVGLIILTLISFFLHLIFDNKLKLKTHFLNIFILLFTSLLIYNSLTSFARNNSLQVVMVYLVFIIFYFLFINTIKDEKQLYKIVSTFLFAGFIVSLYGIYQYITGNINTDSWIDEEMFKDIKVRVYSTFANPNVLGEYLLLLIPLSIGFLWAAKGWLRKAIFMVFSLTMLLCLMLTFSRGCWLGLLFALMIFAFCADRRLLLLAFIGLFILSALLPAPILNRFTSIGDLKDTSSSYRLSIWLGTINMLRDYWVSGIGIGSEAFNRIYPFYAYSGTQAQHSHNLYLQILSEMGYLGLISFLLIIFLFYKQMLTAYFKTNNKFISIFLISICASISGYLLQGMFDNVWYNYRVFLIFWILISFGIAANNLTLAEEANQES